jgi:hypothetical protein
MSSAPFFLFGSASPCINLPVKGFPDVEKTQKIGSRVSKKFVHPIGSVFFSQRSFSGVLNIKNSHNNKNFPESSPTACFNEDAGKTRIEREPCHYVSHRSKLSVIVNGSQLTQCNEAFPNGGAMRRIKEGERLYITQFQSEHP